MLRNEYFRKFSSSSKMALLKAVSVAGDRRWRKKKVKRYREHDDSDAVKKEKLEAEEGARCWKDRLVAAGVRFDERKRPSNGRGK